MQRRVIQTKSKATSADYHIAPFTQSDLLKEGSLNEELSLLLTRAIRHLATDEKKPATME